MAAKRNVLQSFQAVEGCGSAGSENIFGFIELAQIGLARTAVQMTLAAQHDDAGGVERLAVKTQQLARRGCRVRPGFQCRNDSVKKLRLQNRIRIQHEYVLRRMSSNQIVVRFRKS